MNNTTIINYFNVDDSNVTKTKIDTTLTNHDNYYKHDLEN